jgi:hypothetical protein
VQPGAKKVAQRPKLRKSATKVAAAPRPRLKRPWVLRHPILTLLGIVCVAAAAVTVKILMFGPPSHSISAPQRLGSYVQAPSLASGMGAGTLRDDLVTRSGGEASHVVDAVYEDSTGPAAKAGPQIILFVGGNLSGSAGSFILSLTQTPGAYLINAGSLGGQAACVPGLSGHLTECAWADNDTFGVVASPNLNAVALSTELRTIRPLVEHTLK